MRLELTVDYDVPEDEFDELIKLYPLGKYLGGGNTQWFRVEIDTQHGFVSLTWFKRW